MFTIRFLCLLAATVSLATSLHLSPNHRALKDSSIKLFFYSQTNADGIEVDPSEPSSLSKINFSSEKQTVFLVHGWTNSYSSSSVQTIKDSYLKTADLNVFILDWSSVASKDYADAVRGIVDVGRETAGQVDALVKQAGLNLNNTGIVGHSLGAHVSGLIGANLNGAVRFIVGLDPAGPSFSLEDASSRLNTSDAQFVQIVHTDSENYGIADSIGHADYWPNGGKDQPGCTDDANTGCSHSRSYQYFAESLETGNFIGVHCTEGWDQFLSDLCAMPCSVPSWIGQLDIDFKGIEDYYLATNDSPPYAQGQP